MNYPAPTHLIVTRDYGETNRKLLAKEAAADLTRVESASRKVNITLASPEGKRLYLRCFYVSQANFHFISVFARMKLPAEDVDQVEQELRTMLDARIVLANQRIVAFEKLCHQHGIAFCTGMRPSEYIALQWAAVDEPHHQVSVAGAFVDGEMKDRAKTLSGLRTIDMRCGALDALQAQRALTGAGAGTVFLHPRSRKPWQGDKPIYNCWKRIIKASGVRFRNPYQTRHTFASNLLMLGALPLYVATQMGHADTTMIVRTYGKWIAAGLDHGRRERLLSLYAQTNPLRADEFPKYN